MKNETMFFTIPFTKLPGFQVRPGGDLPHPPPAPCRLGSFSRQGKHGHQKLQGWGLTAGSPWSGKVEAQ